MGDILAYRISNFAWRDPDRTRDRAGGNPPSLTKKPGLLFADRASQALTEYSQLSRNERSLRERLGCFSLRKALASI